jgi:cell wall assembly regulator SMI1
MGRKEISRSWQRIARWHGAHGVTSFKLAPGADKSKIAKAERTLGFALPEDVRLSWELHDGGATDSTWILTYGDLLPLDRLVAQWQTYCEWQRDEQWGLREHYEAEAVRGPIKPVWWSPKRIAVTDNGGDALMIDLDPPPSGTAGQTIAFDHEVGPTEVLAASWSEFLDLWAAELEAGKYIYYPKGGVVALPGAYAERTDVRRFVHPSSGRSWEISVHGDSLQVAETEPDGSTLCRSFAPGPEKMMEEYARLVAEKETEGYLRRLR